MKSNKCAIAQLFRCPVSFAKGRFTVPFEVDLHPLDLLLPLLSPVALPCFGQTNQEIRRSTAAGRYRGVARIPYTSGTVSALIPSGQG